MKKEIEVWRDVLGYENLYKVSNLGRARSCERYVVNGWGSRLVKGRLLQPIDAGNGYLRLHLSKNNNKKLISLHRAIAIAFIPNVNNEKTVDHKDENKLNNRVDNLQWMSSGDNTRKSSCKPVKISKGDIMLKFDSGDLASKYIKCHRASVGEAARGFRPTIKGWLVTYI